MVYYQNSREYNRNISLKLEQRFLLQFVTQEHKWKNFSEYAQNILAQLKKDFFKEAQIFNAIERYEYFYYAVEHMHNKELIRNVSYHQTAHLDEYAFGKNKIPGFDTIWTREHSRIANVHKNLYGINKNS